MSRPSATQSPVDSSARWLSTSAARTAGSAARRDATSEISGVRIASETSSPSSRTRSPSNAIRRLAGSRSPASATARYIAPESRYVKPSAWAAARATVDFPAPAGPSMATSIAWHDRGVKLLRPLRERDFALLWTGMTVSLLGDGIFVVAEAWQVYDLDNDPIALSIVGTAWTLGMVAFLLTGGVVTDRVDRRRVLILADVVRAAALVAMGLLSVTGVIEIWHLVVLSVFMGIGEAFFGPAFGAIVPDLVSAELLVQANALQQLVQQAAAKLLGPALGGFVVALIGAGPAFLVDAGTFVLSALCVAALKARSRATERARSARNELREGLAFVRREPWLWSTLIAASLSLLFFLGPLEVLLPYVIRNALGGGAAGFGAVLAAAGAGAIAVSLVLSQRGVPRRYLTFMYALWAVATLPLIGYAVGTALWQFLLLGAFYGACETGGMVVWARSC